MELLKELFPALKGEYDGEVPCWKDSDKPWNILRNDGYGIQAQISKLTIIDDDGIFIHPEAKIDDGVYIEGPSYIGPMVEIRNGAYLRAGSWICAGSLVGHCSEIKNSILLPGSKAPHFNYVGDSILGFGVNIGAGVKLSNVRNDRRGVMVTMEDGSRSESGLRKLGALIGDGSQLGCNSVTNPGVIISRGSLIAPNETVNGRI